MTALIASFIFVVLAEMGDKTQLLAMAFAARYSAYKVLLAVFIATIINHGLAVAAGRFLSTVMPMDIISFVAAFSFIIFGLWTIRGDKLKGEDKKESRFGPVVTVAIAFFLAEMGDKTQLATISLAVKYQNMFNVLMGTTLGMVVADAIGIIVGIVMRKHIPEKIIKWFSAAVFILFGLAGIYKVLSVRLDSVYTFFILLFIFICSIYGAFYLSKPKSERCKI
jgi:Ca2+/H+ antiporter, TMEM165/GDT1 family